MPPPPTPKVSIILPVYNAGEYLHQCPQSLIDQTLKEIEIIAVLDCPTDGSDRVVREYAARDPRIRVIANEENLRVGLSCNRGIEAARGEYIGFCDHDDYVEPDMFERLYEAARRHDTDMTVCDYRSVNAFTGKQYPVEHPTGAGAALRDKLLRAALVMRSPSYGEVIWNVLYRRGFLMQHGLRFPDNRLITSEDHLFLSKAYLLTDRVAHCNTPAPLYNHVYYGGNTVQQYFYKNIALAVNYAADLDGFLHTQADPALQHAYRFDAAEGTMRQLYSAFRREIRFKGFRYALQQACLAGHNEMVHHLLAPYRSWNGAKQACRTLPPTKLAFACLLHLAHLTGIRIRHQAPQ